MRFSLAPLYNQASEHTFPEPQVTKAISDTQLVISGATAASLALGRFVLLPIQRKFNEKVHCIAGLLKLGGAYAYDSAKDSKPFGAKHQLDLLLNILPLTGIEVC